MCGIAGVFAVRIARESLRSRLEGMAESMYHRGPDAAGIWIDASAAVGLAHRRLAIVDLSPRGAQPMLSASGRYALVFNGEIYNHRELRSELLALGYPFRGESDTEVLLAGIEQWGLERTLPRLVGMFALALWDEADHSLSLAIDRLGEKPLHYVPIAGGLLFASEMKAFKVWPEWRAEIDPASVAEYLGSGYIAPPRSIYRDVRKVHPGTFCCFRLGSDLSQPERKAYWSVGQARLDAMANRFKGTPEEAVLELDRLLRRAVELQMVADVPVGAFLSGGVDSSTIVGMMQRVGSRPVKTFAVGFWEKAFNEAHHARKVAEHLRTEHTEIVATAKDALHLVGRLGAIYDEPFADASQIPTLLVAELARQQVTVSLSGDAGDELFLGYKNYSHVWKTWRAMRWIPLVLRVPAARLVRHLGVAAPGVGDWGRRLERGARVLPARSLLETHRLLSTIDPNVLLRRGEVRSYSPVSSGDFAALGTADLQHYLPGDILVKVDRASMAVSLESRIPMLDHRVVEFALSLPDNFKYRDGRGKWVLRRVLDNYVDARLVDRPKQGFGVPVAEWLRGALREWAESLIGPNKLRQQEWFDPTEVNQMWRRHLNGSHDLSGPLWRVLIFQQWLRYAALSSTNKVAP